MLNQDYCGILSSSAIMNPFVSFFLGTLSNIYVVDDICFIVSLPVLILRIAPFLPLTMSFLIH